jgi:hypothetical protein
MTIYHSFKNLFVVCELANDFYRKHNVQKEIAFLGPVQKLV